MCRASNTKPCRAKSGKQLTNKNQVLPGLKEHFEEHLNEGSESDQPTRPVGLRDDGVDIDLPSRAEIEGVLKYLKNNQAADADSIPAELLNTKSSPKFYTTTSYPTLTWPFSIIRLGSNQVNPQQINSLHCAKS
jgi:hypothetical protein